MKPRPDRLSVAIENAGPRVAALSFGYFTQLMKIEEFKKQGRAWHKSVPLKTSYGDFDVHLLAGKPDQHMLMLATNAAKYLQENIEYIVDVVFAHYNWAVKTWGAETVCDLGMPKKVDRKNILSLIPRRFITVDRLDKDDYVCSIGFDIPYDPEHGLRLSFEDGAITSINEAAFTLKKGCLKYERE